MKPSFLPKSLAVGVLLLAGGVGIAPASEGPGAAAYAAACAKCHADAAAIGGRATDLAVPERRLALDRFLQRHHARDAAARAAIIEHLASVRR